MKEKEKVKHDEKWLLSKGWEKINGYRVDPDEIASMSNESGEFYVEDKNEIEGIYEATYYENPIGFPEYATEELDEAIEMQEEYDTDEKEEVE